MAASRGRGTRPNIVWIYGDEWRHDATGFAGNPVVQTPHLDALAARATHFSDTYCESPVCQSARASILTASFPRDHGKYQNGPRYGAFPAPDRPNILHRLQEAGYRTAAIGKMHFHSAAHSVADMQAYGLDDVLEEYDKGNYRFDVIDTPYKRHLQERGLFDEWIASQTAQGALIHGTDPDRVVLAEDLEVDDTLDGFLGQQAARYVREHATDEQPFFLWLGFIGPHPPYDAPVPYSGRYAPDDVPLGPLGFDPQPANAYGEYVTWVRDLMHCERYGEDEWRQIAAYYYGNITLVDDQVGRVLRALDDAGIADDTWVVFSADHGELMGDHGLIQKAVFYETSVRVPALVAAPGGKRQTVDAPVQAIDLAVTLLEAAGADATGFAGRPLLSADGTPTPAAGAVFSQIADFTMAFDGRYKLVVHRETLEPLALYDLEADPHERVELLGPGGHRRVVDDLLERLVRPFADGKVPARR